MSEPIHSRPEEGGLWHLEKAAGNPALEEYLRNNLFDLEFFMDALSENNQSGCFFFGDMVRNMYYISHNMMKKFGLKSNILHGLPLFLLGKIRGEDARVRYRRAYWKALEEKRDSLDIYHQVYTAGGRLEWIHFYARVQWAADRPLFCAGRLTMQDASMMVDCVSNFNWETVMCQRLSQLRETGGHARIIGFSLNDISKVNNLQGRAFGDYLIHSVAEELLNEFSENASFYKLSGMRCGALLKNGCEDRFPELIEGMRKIIEKRYSQEGIQVFNPCSFTVMDFPGNQESTLDFLEDLNSCIKLARRELAAPYVDSRNLDIRKIQNSANMALELGRDVAGNMQNFRVVVQPVVDCISGKIVAGECLLRWRCQGENVSPALFIPVLESENLINPVGRWVFEEAVKVCRRIVPLHESFHLSVNVSLQQLDDAGFPDFIRETLQKYQLDGSHIFVEMTESCMDREQDKLLKFLDSCESMGIKVALDDFGTGYSSIRVLMQYPTSIIKLDRSLLMEMEKSEDKMNFISAIVLACHQFGKLVCIEGVETREQRDMVRKASCDMIQGFYYYKPTEVEELLAIMTGQSSLWQ